MPVASDLYYSSYQKGEDVEIIPVVLIHGAGGNHLYWPPEVRRLPGSRVFALDLPGHGLSEGRGEQSISAYARRVVDWLDALDMHQAVFVGHSMGSAIALTLALDYAEHVIGLVMVGGGARMRVRADILNNCASPTTFPIAVDRIMAGSFGSQADPRLVELAGKRMLEIRPTVLHSDLLACDTFEQIERLGEVAVPTLILCGSEDQMTPLRYSQLLAGAIPKATLKVIPGAGHMVQLEQPEEVAQALSEFVAGLDYDPGKTHQ